jgi:hypothetical protein
LREVFWLRSGLLRCLCDLLLERLLGVRGLLCALKIRLCVRPDFLRCLCDLLLKRSSRSLRAFVNLQNPSCAFATLREVFWLRSGLLRCLCDLLLKSFSWSLRAFVNNVSNRV